MLQVMEILILHTEDAVGEPHTQLRPEHPSIPRRLLEPLRLWICFLTRRGLESLT